MSLYFTVTKRRIIFLILIMLLIAITVAEFLNVGNYRFNASTAKARLEFAERVGCEIKDKNKCVLSISLELGNYYIEVECEEGTPVEKVNKIADNILKRIG